jgi:hypothetical protein
MAVLEAAQASPPMLDPEETDTEAVVAAAVEVRGTGSTVERVAVAETAMRS